MSEAPLQPDAHRVFAENDTVRTVRYLATKGYDEAFIAAATGLSRAEVRRIVKATYQHRRTT